MQVFNTALKIVRRNPVYLIVYIIALSFLGLFLVTELVGSEDSHTYEESRASVAIVDRDGGALAQGLSDEMSKRANMIEIVDNKQALQDAIAQGITDYIIIIEPGFSTTFMESISEEKSTPRLETIVSYVSIYGTMMNQVTNQYLALMSTLMIANPHASAEELVGQASRAMESTVHVEVVSSGDSEQLSTAFAGFLRFLSYPLTVGILVCVTMLMAAFNRGDIRRRNLASPLKLASFNFQTALACFMIALFAWAWTCTLSFIVFGATFEGVPVINLALIMLIVLTFVTVPLALGYLFAQLGLKENAANAAGNILAMALSFLGGAWIDLELLGSEVVSVAHFTPSYWYTNAISQMAELTTTPSQATLISVFSDMGIILLFAVAIFVIALVVGKMKVQSAEAGGNTAAARSRT